MSTLRDLERRVAVLESIVSGLKVQFTRYGSKPMGLDPRQIGRARGDRGAVAVLHRNVVRTEVTRLLDEKKKKKRL